MAEDRQCGDDAELRALRARAYGASADIDDDPDAVRRLADLERQARRAIDDAPSVVEDRTPHDSPGGKEDETPSASPQPVADQPDAPIVAASPGRLARRRLIVAWVLSIVVTATLAVAATILVTGANAAGGSHRVALLEVDPAFVPPSNFLGGDTRGFVPFEGLTAISTTAGLGAEDEEPCLVVMTTDDYNASADTGTLEGSVYTGCRAQQFPASAQFVIDAASPEPLRERFGTGRGIRFVLEDGRVGVYVDG